MKFEYVPQNETPAHQEARENIKVWQQAFDNVWKDLQEVQRKEGTLNPDDQRLTAVKICAMRLDQVKQIMEELKSA